MTDSTGIRPAAPTAPRRARSAWLGALLSPVPIALIVGTAVTAALGLAGVPAFAGWRAAIAGGLTVMFLVAASGRLGPQRAGLVAMVPSALPRPELIVAATGVLETAGAVGLWIPATERIAAACLGLLLIAVFPANVRAARHGGTPLLSRAVEQLVFLACCAAVAFG